LHRSWIVGRCRRREYLVVWISISFRYLFFVFVFFFFFLFCLLPLAVSLCLSSFTHRSVYANDASVTFQQNDVRPVLFRMNLDFGCSVAILFSRCPSRLLLTFSPLCLPVRPASAIRRERVMELPFLIAKVPRSAFTLCVRLSHSDTTMTSIGLTAKPTSRDTSRARSQIALTSPWVMCLLLYQQCYLD
jgi:hypothetical protein